MVNNNMSHKQTYMIDPSTVKIKKQNNNNNNSWEILTLRQVILLQRTPSTKGVWSHGILVSIFLGSSSSLTVHCSMQIWLFYFSCVSILIPGTSVHHICLVPMGSEEGTKSLLIQPHVSNYVGAGNWSWVLYENKCS